MQPKVLIPLIAIAVGVAVFASNMAYGAYQQHQQTKRMNVLNAAQGIYDNCLSMKRYADCFEEKSLRDDAAAYAGRN